MKMRDVVGATGKIAMALEPVKAAGATVSEIQYGKSQSPTGTALETCWNFTNKRSCPQDGAIAKSGLECLHQTDRP